MTRHDAHRERLAQIVRTDAHNWGADKADSYHAPAEAHMEDAWARFIAPVLTRHPIDYARTIDFACGRGRNARKLKASGAGEVVLVDVDPTNVAYCRQAFSEPGFRVVRNDGIDLAPIESGWATFLYTFDSMVHFDVELVAGYLPEFFRVLAPGGLAFVHHSNYAARPGAWFGDNPHARNYMTMDLFRHFALRAGFDVLEQSTISWQPGDHIDLDGLTVLRKPPGAAAALETPPAGLLPRLRRAARRLIRDGGDSR